MRDRAHVHPAPRTPHPAFGLTLIEILLSLVILSTAVTFIMQALARGAVALHVAKNLIGAYAFADAKLADAQLALAQHKDPSGSGSFRQGRDPFEWTMAIAPWADALGVDEVTLQVAWQQGGQRYTRDVALLHRVPPSE